MPERVTKEERLVSMVIAKAREVKELLHLSLNDNNRSPVDDKSEVVKLKRPKAEKDTTKFEANKGPANEHGFAGEETSFKKGISIMKSILKEYDEMMDNPVLNRERAELAAADLEDTRKDLDGLEEMLRSGQMSQKDFEQKYQSMLRRLTRLGQKLGPFPPKKTQPLLGSKRQYR